MTQSDLFSLSLDPFAFFKVMARSQCESMALMSRRAKALADLPKVLAGCHSPEDFLTEQVRFWQVAQRQYADSFERTFGASPFAGGAAAEAAVTTPSKRDYLVVAERPAAQPKEQAPAAVQEAADRLVRVRRSA